MNNGQRRLRVSRCTTISVLMHWQESAKKTIKDSPISGEYAAEPSARRSFLILSRSGVVFSSASPMPYTRPSVEMNTSRAANAPISPTPIFQSKPSG